MSRKTVLVTGASRGIGKAIAVKFAKKGYNVAISCIRTKDRLLQTQKETILSRRQTASSRYQIVRKMSRRLSTRSVCFLAKRLSATPPRCSGTPPLPPAARSPTALSSSIRCSTSAHPGPKDDPSAAHLCTHHHERCR